MNTVKYCRSLDEWVREKFKERNQRKRECAEEWNGNWKPKEEQRQGVRLSLIEKERVKFTKERRKERDSNGKIKSTKTVNKEEEWKNNDKNHKRMIEKEQNIARGK